MHQNYSNFTIILRLCSQKETIDFRDAEAAFNNGSIEKAKQLYENFIINYPTSKWRVIADKAIGKVLSD